MRIHIKGNQFLIGDEVRPYFFRTSFCLMGHYQAGHRDKARAWLDRNKQLGFDGVRVFGENEDWFQGGAVPAPGPDFYGTTATPRIIAFGKDAPANSSLKLVSGYERLVDMLAEDLEAWGMVAEFCCIATVKGRDPAITSHGLNCFAQLFDKMFPDPKQSPFLFEAVNEWNAHSHLDATEMHRIGQRWRREAPERNYPGSTIGISAGGSWDPGFDDSTYTHRNLHPPRGADWGNLNGLLTAKAKDRPTALNETVHYMTPEEWDKWTPTNQKWIGLSTKDHTRLVRYYQDVLAMGVSVCAHDLIGQMTDPDQPLSPLELAIKEWRAPGPPPPPPKRYRYRRVIELAFQELLGRDVDQAGLEGYNQAMLNGTTEAQLRESIIRSDEYARKNPQT